MTPQSNKRFGNSWTDDPEEVASEAVGRTDHDCPNVSKFDSLSIGTFIVIVSFDVIPVVVSPNTVISAFWDAARSYNYCTVKFDMVMLESMKKTNLRSQCSVRVLPPYVEHERHGSS